ncbi:MAG: glycoside hydrolase family 3 N-terminal domain-containing protein [Gemmatimonadota bacterium]
MIPAGRVFLEALRLDREEAEAVRRRAIGALELDVAGFVLFGGEAGEVGRLTEDLRERAGRPLWFAADLERGAGQQFAGLTMAPPPAGLARHPDPVAAVREAAERTALEARSVGVNWVLAPVLDLDLGPENPIVGTRSFGENPAEVAALGEAWIEACQDAGVAACAKHFPGHGRTTADSHAELPVVAADRATLLVDLEPFRRVAGRVASMMTAHVAYPALGCGGPATRDPGVLGQLLRDELGFGGLVVTDALIMEGARADTGGGRAGGAEIEALAAGCDLLLYPPDLAAAVRRLGREATASDALAGRIAAAAARSRETLSRFEPHEPPPRPGTGSDADGEGGGRKLAEACIVAVGEDPASRLDPGRETAIAAVWDDRPAPGRPPLGEVFAAELQARGWRIADPDAAGAARVLLVAATPQGWKGAATLTEGGRAAVRAQLRTLPPAYVIVLGHLRLLDALGGIGACAWGAEPALEAAAARWLDDRVRRGRAGA